MSYYISINTQGASMVNLHSEDIETSWVSNSSEGAYKRPQGAPKSISAERGLGGGHLWGVLLK